MALPPGSLVALRYRIGPLLGQGGMGVVYRARHLGLDRDVALKIVPPEIGGGAATVRFEREARNGARLDHPGCARVLDVGTTPDGHRFLALELIDGPTLRARMSTPVPADEAARIGAAILDHDILGRAIFEKGSVVLVLESLVQMGQEQAYRQPIDEVFQVKPSHRSNTRN